MRKAITASQSGEMRADSARYYTPGCPGTQSLEFLNEPTRCSDQAAAGPRQRLSRSTQPPARRRQIDTPFGQDSRCVAGGQDGNKRAGKNVARVMRTDDYPARRHDRRCEGIKQEVLRPEIPESRHQRDDCGAVARWKGPVVGVPAEPGEIINIGLNEQLWPGSAENHLKYIDHDSRGCYRKKQKGRYRRQCPHGQGKSPQTRHMAAPVEHGKGKPECN